MIAKIHTTFDVFFSSASFLFNNSFNFVILISSSFLLSKSFNFVVLMKSSTLFIVFRSFSNLYFLGYAKPKRNTHQKNLRAPLIAYAHYIISFTFRI